MGVASACARGGESSRSWMQLREGNGCGRKRVMLRLRWAFFGAIMALAAVAGANVAQARQLQATITATCAGIPTYLDAYDYTIRAWPYASVQASEELKQNLLYFTAAVRTDKLWCD